MIPRTLMPLKPLPLAVDPPTHARYRAVINPGFMPGKVAKMRDDASDLTIELTEKRKPNGGCAFLREFARVMPVTDRKSGGEGKRGSVRVAVGGRRRSNKKNTRKP